MDGEVFCRPARPNVASLTPWAPPPTPPPQPPQPQSLAWPQYPLHPLSAPSRLIDADRCTPGGLVKVDNFTTTGGRWTDTYYAPTAADLAVLDRLEPGCPLDSVPWERFRAELIVAPTALLRQREWRRMPAAALLILVERLRSDLAADDAASRGIAEPETKPPAPSRHPTERSEGRKIAGRVLLDAWRQAGEGKEAFPGYSSLIETTKRLHGVEINKDHLCRARGDLGEHADAVRRWVNPRRLAPVQADEQEPTPGEIEECREWFMKHPRYQRKGVFERVNELTEEAWKVLAAQSTEHWETMMQQYVKEGVSGIR